MAFVADNSIIIGWFIPSQASDLRRKALRMSRRERVHVPALWQSEFSNVLVGLERRGLIAGLQVDAIVDEIEAFANTVKVKGRFNLKKLIEDGRK